jgi:hypothetical protein
MYSMLSQQNDSELKIMVLFRCHNPLCAMFETPLEQPITRTALRKMSQPDSRDKFRCVKCGQLFSLTEQEKASNLEMR